MNLKIAYLILISSVACNAQNNSHDNEEIKLIFDKDQYIRTIDTINTALIDSVHRIKIIELLVEGKIKTSLDKFRAAFVLQHTPLEYCEGNLKSKSVENYLIAYNLFKSAYLGGVKDAQYFTAAAYDRYLLYLLGYQKYGTQRVYDEPSDSFIWAYIDPKTTDNERAIWGVPAYEKLLEKYKMKMK